MKIRIFDVKTRFASLLALVLGLAAAGPALAVCDVTLSSILPNNQAVLKANCGNANMTEITWTRDFGTGAVANFGPFLFPATLADINFTTLLTSGTHSYTASGYENGTGTANSGTLVASGKAAVVTLSQPILTVAVSPGGSVTSAPLSTSVPIGINGCTNTGGVCAAGFDTGTTVVLTPTPTGSGFVFSGWGGDCSGNGNCTLSMTTLRTASATFSTVPTYALTVASPTLGTVTGSAGSTNISCGIAGSGACQASGLVSGTAVSLTAAPSGGNVFSGWSGGSCSGTGACSFNIGSSNANVTATFSAAPTYALRVIASANGTVSGGGINLCSSAGGSNCNVSGLTSSTGPTLTATPQPNFFFSGWSGGGCSGTGTCTPTLVANTITTVSASFVSTPTYTVTGVASPSAGGSVSCSSPVTSGSTTTCTISTNTGYTLTGASSNACGGSRSGSTYTTGSVTSACTVTATFTTSTGTASCGAGETMAAGDRVWSPFNEVQLWPVPPVTGSGVMGRAIQFVADSAKYPRGVLLGGVDESQPSKPKDYVVSACPHSFTPVAGNPMCAKSGAGSIMGPMYLRFGPAETRTFFGQPLPSLDCALTPGGTYYVNYRDSSPAFGGVSSQFVINKRLD